MEIEHAAAGDEKVYFSIDAFGKPARCEVSCTRVHPAPREKILARNSLLEDTVNLPNKTYLRRVAVLVHPPRVRRAARSSASAWQLQSSQPKQSLRAHPTLRMAPTLAT